VATLLPTAWRATLQLTATIAAQQSADIAAERPGRVVAVLFSSGEAVPAGAPLVQLDDAAEAAQLEIDTAKLNEARNTLARAEKLMTISGASQADLESAQANAAEDAAQLKYDAAALAQLDITAPFAGTLGIRKISAGDYVSTGQVVASLTQPTPLRVLFSLPQTQAAGIETGEPFTIAAASGGAPLTAAGKITALSPALDAATDARDAEGVITDPAALFLPGMAGTVTLATGTPQPAFLAPATALNDSVLGQYVFALQPAGAAFTLQTVYITELGRQGSDAVISTAGLQSGERIVSIGGFKLTDGASVTPEAQ
jgi:RND family efflux transporter MFP subunit